MNERAKEWLKGEMVDKDKWALAYDEGGKLYGIMTTNNIESVNIYSKVFDQDLLLAL